MSTGGIEGEYKRLNAKNGWQEYYQEIRTESAKYSNTCLESVKPQNKTFNRYRDVSPYDHSRIVLQRGTCDYINANLIKVEKANRQYILTQGPLSNTVEHFWLMIWEQNSKAVLMLNKLVEKKQEKCYQYWPSKIGPDHTLKFNDVGLSVEYIAQEDHSYYLTRVLRLKDTDTGESRDILQFHYTTWPDFGVPTSPTLFLEFLRKVRAAGVLESDVGPAVVHCSAGIGRSGTFCLVDSCLVLIEKFGENTVSVKDILLEMRKYRTGLIQTPEQLRFSYQAIIEGAKQLSGHQPTFVEDENVNNIIKITNNSVESDGTNSSDDEPPPLPPPRLDSLNRNYEGNPADRPLPTIPNSASLSDCNYEDSDSFEEIPSPLPAGMTVEEHSSEDELEEENTRTESPASDKSENAQDTLSPAALRQRKRHERKLNTEAQVRDMKRRQQANEQWTQLKRSLYKPLVFTGMLVLGGGLLAYIYLKD